ALRWLFARGGVIVCPACNATVMAHGAAEVVAEIEAQPAGTRCAVAFPVRAKDALEQPVQWAGLLEEGYVRIQVGAALHRLDEAAPLVLPTNQEVWVVVDRMEAGKTPHERIADSVEAALRRGDGRAGVLTDGRVDVFDRRHVCAGCQREFPAPTPRLFDLSDPLGACPECRGFGAL